MTNIWEILLHSILVTLVALFLLGLQSLVKLHLSPRFRCNLWFILAVRLCLPVVIVGHTAIPNLYLFMETLKTKIELSLNSQFAHPYLPMNSTFSLPFFPTGSASSVTDWLFMFYWMGVISLLGYYFIGYVHLRVLLHKGAPMTDELMKQVAFVSDKYALKRCKITIVDGVATPFVCGMLTPILAFPSGQTFDDKVILHELIHFNQKHPQQNAFWCIARALHWWNPVLQWVFSRIANDIESLCDCMVLEKLEEKTQRKDYGKLLLSMADVNSTGFFGTSTMGTSCISNGGKKLLRRISLIIDFKPYSKDMNLLSMAIISIITIPMCLGNSVSYATFSDPTDSWSELRLLRSNSIPTVVENYVQSMLTHDPLLFALVSPLAQHEALEQEYRSEKIFQHPTPFPKTSFYLHGRNEWVEGEAEVDRDVLLNTTKTNVYSQNMVEFIYPFDMFDYTEANKGHYSLSTLIPIEHGYEALLVFPVAEVKIKGELLRSPLPDFTQYEEEIPEPSEFVVGYFTVPIEIILDIDGNYVIVPQDGSGVYLEKLGEPADRFFGNSAVPFTKQHAKGSLGQFTHYIQTFATIDNKENDPYSHNAVFEELGTENFFSYEYHGNPEDHAGVKTVKLVMQELNFYNSQLSYPNVISDVDEIEYFFKLKDYTTLSEQESSRYSLKTEPWSGTIFYNSVTSYQNYPTTSLHRLFSNSSLNTSYKNAVAVYWDNELVDYAIFEQEVFP